MTTQHQESPACSIGAVSMPSRAVFTVPQFSWRYPAFTEAALRNLIFKAGRRHSTRGEIPGNGLLEAGAVIRVGRKVLIDEARFFAWIDGQAAGASKAMGGRHA